MKAMFMKVNYDPKYLSPGIKPSDRLQTRLGLTKQIYSKPKSDTAVPKGGNKQGRIHLSAPDFAFRSLKHNDDDNSALKHVPNRLESLSKGDESISTTKLREHEENHSFSEPSSPDHSPSPPSKSRTDRHKAGVAKAHISVRLKPLRDANSPGKLYRSECVAWMPNQNSIADPQKPGPYIDRQRRHLSQSNFNVFPQKRLSAAGFSKSGEPYFKGNGAVPAIQRSRTMPAPEKIRFRSVAMIDMERRARVEAERAIRDKKVFTINGPYHSLRDALRRRGWVEKFVNCPNPSELQNRQKKNASPDTDNDDDDNQDKKKENRCPPWEEESGYYALMSYLVRNNTPTFVFSVKSSDVDSRVTKSGQLVNHFGKARNFTTKSGLCMNLRSVPWYDKTDPDTFYPRSYKLDEPEEKDAFIEDYKWTACMSFVRLFVKRYNNQQNLPGSGDGSRMPRLPLISSRAVDMAVQQCERFLKFRDHDDIDDLIETDILAECQWEQFLNWYYMFVHEGCDVSPVTVSMVKQCEELRDRCDVLWPQALLDGVQNVWMIKPGAKSRGRGIQCVDNLEEILKLVDASDGSMVTQKYIERPFLVYNTKFDIRQWFLVTDWNPLTVWFYQDCYVRFCSREFTLHDFQAAVHLSNNSVTKYLQNGPRSAKLPEDNTWTSDEFQEYLLDQGQGGVWQEKVIPGMKKAITCALLCTQELVEGRKSAYELYGADFMLTDDMQPWLLEINSSPSMARNTHATDLLVERVLEDTLKVVLDRRCDKNSDSGRFEQILRQSVIHDPPSIDPSLVIQGRRLRNKKHEKSPQTEKNHKNQDKQPDKNKTQEKQQNVEKASKRSLLQLSLKGTPAPKILIKMNSTQLLLYHIMKNDRKKP